jgi:hypothetical protein
MVWVVRAFDGDLLFEESDEGSVVILRLRRQ